MAEFGYLIIGATLVFFTTAIRAEDEIKQLMQDMIEDCRMKTGASEDDVAALRNHKLPDTKEGICMFECFFNNADVMKEGKYNKEGLITALTPLMGGDHYKLEKLNEMAEKCGEFVTKDTSDKCVIAQKLMHCTVEEGQKFGFEYPNNF